VRAKVNSKELDYLKKLKRHISRITEQNEALRRDFDEREERHIRQLASLKRADYRGQLPATLAGVQSLLPWRKNKRLRRLAHTYRLIASSPLFDADWYLANNPDVAAMRMDPVLHYLENGALEGRSPGPQFDAAAYLRRYPDVAEKGEIALLHYLRHGSREDRKTLVSRESAPRASIAAETECTVAVPFGFVTKPVIAARPIAAIIHIYYSDMANELRRYLDSVPGDVDVFISTADRASKEIVEEAFSNWAKGKVEIRIMPNRGRDIAPKLLGFQDVYRCYDIFVHLHSKRSLHTDGLESWRRHLCETLVGSSLVASSVIDAFQRNPRLGMISSSHFEPVRDRLAWGSNFDCAARLAEMMGFTIDSTAPLDFPSGSMFWARSEALRPLLDLNLSSDEFEDEEGQIDGTLAHALERLFFYICERAGFDWMKISRPDMFPTRSTVYRIESPNEVDGFLRDRSLRLLDPVQRRFRAPLPEFVPLTTAAPAQEKPAKLVAFYLPQFHAIPENDAWWGKGFTEWANVRASVPLFEGHRQPHVPIDLGYYDLLQDGVMARQAELAKLYGIEGFCFYHYWFSGKRLLNKPVDQLLTDKRISISFCLCWANENWTRRWDGLENEILIAQNYSKGEETEFIKSVAVYMRDERYITISGKPLLLVYRPKLLPRVKQTAETWRRWCVDNGIGEIYLASTTSFEESDPSVYGFDAAVEFSPNNASPRNLTDTVTPLTNEFNGTVFDWNSLPERDASRVPSPYKLYRCVCPMWDNTPRRKNSGTAFVNNTPKAYQRWLMDAIDDTVQRAAYTPDERLIFINAWNEWGEGAHLEPDTANGYAYLQATRAALEEWSRRNAWLKALDRRSEEESYRHWQGPQKRGD
jgi:lipopolysaccharide biosynthesis protein